MSSKKLETLEILLEYGICDTQRTIYLNGEINEVTGSHVQRGLGFLDSGSGDIKVIINTPGGLVSEMFAIYDSIRACKNKIITIGTGEICSAGCLILVAGDVRQCYQNSWFMSHSSSMTIGNLDTWALDDRIKAMKEQENRWAELMASRTKMPIKWWLNVHKKNKRELWLSANEMVAHGIVDSIITN